MLWDVQYNTVNMAVVDVRLHDPKQDRQGDAKPPYHVTVSELTLAAAESLREKGWSRGGDGFEPAETNPARSLSDDAISAEYTRRNLGTRTVDRG